MNDGNRIDWGSIDDVFNQVVAEQARTPLEGLALDSAPVRLYLDLEERIGEVEAGDLNTVAARTVLDMMHEQLKLLTRFHGGVREGIGSGLPPMEAIRSEMIVQASHIEDAELPFNGPARDYLHTSLYTIATAYEQVYNPRTPRTPLL